MTVVVCGSGCWSGEFEEVGGPPADHVVAVIAASVVVGVQPSVGLALQLADAVEAEPVKRRPPALLEHGSCKRSTTALWFGDRAGMNTRVTFFAARASANLVAWVCCTVR